jgi:hypothetical protein
MNHFERRCEKNKSFSTSSTDKSIFERSKLSLEELEDVKKIPIHH